MFIFFFVRFGEFDPIKEKKEMGIMFMIVAATSVLETVCKKKKTNDWRGINRDQLGLN